MRSVMGQSNFRENNTSEEIVFKKFSINDKDCILPKPKIPKEWEDVRGFGFWLVPDENLLEHLTYSSSSSNHIHDEKSNYNINIEYLVDEYNCFANINDAQYFSNFKDRMKDEIAIYVILLRYRETIVRLTEELKCFELQYENENSMLVLQKKVDKNDELKKKLKNYLRYIKIILYQMVFGKDIDYSTNMNLAEIFQYFITTKNMCDNSYKKFGVDVKNNYQSYPNSSYNKSDNLQPINPMYNVYNCSIYNDSIGNKMPFKSDGVKEIGESDYTEYFTSFYKKMMSVVMNDFDKTLYENFIGKHHSICTFYVKSVEKDNVLIPHNFQNIKFSWENNSYESNDVFCEIQSVLYNLAVSYFKESIFLYKKLTTCDLLEKNGFDLKKSLPYDLYVIIDTIGPNINYVEKKKDIFSIFWNDSLESHEFNQNLYNTNRNKKRKFNEDIKKNRSALKYAIENRKDRIQIVLKKISKTLNLFEVLSDTFKKNIGFKKKDICDYYENKSKQHMESKRFQDILDDVYSISNVLSKMNESNVEMLKEYLKISSNYLIAEKELLELYFEKEQFGNCVSYEVSLKKWYDFIELVNVDNIYEDYYISHRKYLIQLGESFVIPKIIGIYPYYYDLLSKYLKNEILVKYLEFKNKSMKRSNIPNKENYASSHETMSEFFNDDNLIQEVDNFFIDGETMAHSILHNFLFKLFHFLDYDQLMKAVDSGRTNSTVRRRDNILNFGIRFFDMISLLFNINNEVNIRNKKLSHSGCDSSEYTKNMGLIMQYKANENLACIKEYIIQCESLSKLKDNNNFFNVQKSDLGLKEFLIVNLLLKNKQYMLYLDEKRTNLIKKICYHLEDKKSDILYLLSKKGNVNLNEYGSKIRSVELKVGILITVKNTVDYAKKMLKLLNTDIDIIESKKYGLNLMFKCDEESDVLYKKIFTLIELMNGSVHDYDQNDVVLVNGLYYSQKDRDLMQIYNYFENICVVFKKYIHNLSFVCKTKNSILILQTYVDIFSRLENPTLKRIFALFHDEPDFAEKYISQKI